MKANIRNHELETILRRVIREELHAIDRLSIFLHEFPNLRMQANLIPPISGPTIICIQAGNVNTGVFDKDFLILPYGEKQRGRVLVTHAKSTSGLEVCYPKLIHDIIDNRYQIEKSVCFPNGYGIDSLGCIFNFYDLNFRKFFKDAMKIKALWYGKPLAVKILYG